MVLDMAGLVILVAELWWDFHRMDCGGRGLRPDVIVIGNHIGGTGDRRLMSSDSTNK